MSAPDDAAAQGDGGGGDAEPRPGSLRRSYDLRDVQGLVLGAGLWLVVGVFGLHALVVETAGARAAWAYLAVGAIMLPALVSQRVLARRNAGSAFRAVQSLERAPLTYLVGWLYGLGSVATGALLAYIVVAGTQPILARVVPLPVPDVAIAAVVVLAFVAVSAMGWRPSWRLALLPVVATIALLSAVVLGLLHHRLTGQPPATYGVAPPTPDLYRAIALLAGAGWVIELTSRHFRTGRGTVRVAAVVAGPALAALLEIAIRRSEPSLPSLRTLVEVTWPGLEPWVMAIGSLAAFMAWQILALLSARELLAIGAHGVFPGWLVHRYRGHRTPLALVAAQAAITLALFVGAANVRGTDALALVVGLAAFAFLLLQLVVNVAAVTARPGAGDEQAAERTAATLVPAVGAAVCFLLAITLPLSVWLMGIAWIAAAGLSYLHGGRDRMREAQLGSTVFQEGTAAEQPQSEFPILVAIRDPDESRDLVRFAAAVAARRAGHLVLLDVLEVPEALPLGPTAVEGRQHLELLDELAALAETVPGVRCETITRLARSPAQGILDTAAEEGARLIVLGWVARQRGDGLWQAGSTIDAVHARARCQVALVRGTWSNGVRRVLVPVAGGPNAPLAAERALDLTAASDGSVTLLSVVREGDPEQAESAEALLERVRSELPDPGRVQIQVARAASPLHGIQSATAEHDAVVLGATEPSILEPMVSDPLPLRLASAIELPLATVRGDRGWDHVVLRQAWTAATLRMPLLTMDEQRDLLGRMRSASDPTVNYYVLVLLSALIATLGLLLGSAAVIIGAMLIAPLMGPIMGSAAGITFGRLRTIETSATTLLKGSLLAIFVAITTAVASPLVPLTPEVMARTSPNLLDLLVALASGAAGAYVLARREVGEALPGVAIAAALMPPLCVVGIGAAIVNTDVAFGALLLFVANLAAIVMAAAVVFLLLGVRPPRTFERERQLRRSLTVALVSLVVVSVPLGIALAQVVRRDTVQKGAQQIVDARLAEWDARVVDDIRFEHGWRSLVMEATLVSGTAIGPEEVEALRRDMEAELHREVTVRLFVTEGTALESGPGPP